MDKLLTIVVPTYNMQDYLRHCLDSLIVPTEMMALLEVLVINDGSTDDSSTIAHEYEAKYPETFRVIDKENGGHGSAWNVGLSLAVGYYLAFLDSDDWYDTAELQKLLTSLKDCTSDLVLLNKQTFHADDMRLEPFVISGLLPGIEYRMEDEGRTLIKNDITKIYTQCCIYKTSILQPLGNLFVEKVSYDDIIMHVVDVLVPHTFVYFNYTVYYYLLGREGQSLDNNVRRKKVDDVSKVVLSCLAFIKENPQHSSFKDWYAKDLYFNFCYSRYYALSKLPFRESISKLKGWDSEISADFSDIPENKWMKRYRTLPFVLYFSLFRFFDYYARAKRKIRKL